MSSRPVKHSVTLKGHRTSISLEDAFWHELRHIAEDRSLPVNALVAEVDIARQPDTGLASALRVFVLTTLKDQIEAR
ncbi:MAG: ribbon-helix-helix domain-containing protein [Sulfitobacter sp.]